MHGNCAAVLCILLDQKGRQVVTCWCAATDEILLPHQSAAGLACSRAACSWRTHCSSLAVCLSVSLCLSVCLCFFVCLPLRLPAGLFLFHCESVCVGLRLCISCSLSLCLCVCLCFFVCLSPPLCPSACLSLSVSLSVLLAGAATSIIFVATTNHVFCCEKTFVCRDRSVVFEQASKSHKLTNIFI